MTAIHPIFPLSPARPALALRLKLPAIALPAPKLRGPAVGPIEPLVILVLLLLAGLVWLAVGGAVMRGSR